VPAWAPPLARFSDLGINDGFLREVGETLPKGNAALCLLVT